MAAKSKNKKPVKYANPEQHRAMFGKRTSNAAGIHLDGRYRRVRTRGAALNRALSYENS